jgi:hypothetical protein
MFKNKKIALFSISILVFLGFFAFSNAAKAQFGIFDYADALSGLIDIGDPFLSLALWLILIVSMSFVYVLFGAALLQWAIDLPVNLNSPVVLSGWTFVQGLVNLFFVLALLFIAIAYILKLESFPVKKILPRLLLIILLVNFSLLVVGMVTDIGEFFMNTLRSAFGVDFIEMALTPLKSSVSSIIIVFANIILAYVTASVTIYGAIPLAIAFIIQLVTGTLIGSFFQTGLFVIMNLVMGSIFFMYFFLFLGRIVALWLIAIFSPVAFFCLIFPQTKQYFSKWFKALIQWAFMGVVALFLLGLIITMFNQVFQNQPAVVQIGAMGGMGGFTITDAIYNYLFLIIFLFVALKATQKYIPAGAAEGLAMMKGAGGGMAGRVKNFASKAAKTKEVQRISKKMSDVRGGKEYYDQEMTKVKNKGMLAKATVATKSWTRAIPAAIGKRVGEITYAEGKQAEYQDFERRKKKHGDLTPQKELELMRHAPSKLDRLAIYANAIDKGHMGALKKLGLKKSEKVELQQEAQKYHEEFARKDLRKDPGAAASAIEKDQKKELEKVNQNLQALRDQGKTHEADLYQKNVVNNLKDEQELKRKRLGLSISDDETKKYGSLSNKLALELSENNFAKLDEETLKELMTGENSEKFFQNVNSGQLKAASRENKGETRDIIKTQVRAYEKQIRSQNKALFDNLRTSGAVSAGFGISKDEQIGGKGDDKNHLKANLITDYEKESEKIKYKEPKEEAEKDSKLDSFIAHREAMRKAREAELRETKEPYAQRYIRKGKELKSARELDSLRPKREAYEGSGPTGADPYGGSVEMSEKKEENKPWLRGSSRKTSERKTKSGGATGRISSMRQSLARQSIKEKRAQEAQEREAERQKLEQEIKKEKEKEKEIKKRLEEEDKNNPYA